MPQVLSKATFDSVLYDVDLTDLLDDQEVILSCFAPTTDRDVGLEFGSVLVNTAPVAYPRLARTAPIGKAMQCRISRGYLYNQAEQIVNIRWRFVTNFNPRRETITQLRISDQPC